MHRLLKTILIALNIWVLNGPIMAQCLSRVTHTFDTETVGCVDVTVTQDGSPQGGGNACGVGPYYVGKLGTSSFTFTFSQPLSKVSIDVHSINNVPPTVYEEVFIYVNGGQFVLTNAGVPGACLSPAVLTGAGTIVAGANETAMSNNILVESSINSITVECQQNGTMPSNGMIFSLYICCCQTKAGILSETALNLCPNEWANLPEATQTSLDSDDLLQYILFSDINDTLGSILATSDSPSFSFNPATMQPNVVYYIAAIAGNNQNGSVDFNDACLDISNASEVSWYATPTVLFTVFNPEVCLGECTDVTATFTGAPPFVLTFTTPSTSPVTQVFTENIGTFQVCIPTDALPGSLALQATELTDANCTCE